MKLEEGEDQGLEYLGASDGDDCGLDYLSINEEDWF